MLERGSRYIVLLPSDRHRKVLKIRTREGNLAPIPVGKVQHQTCRIAEGVCPVRPKVSRMN